MNVTSYQNEADKTQPYKVRTGCGHIVIRRMRPATAGVPFTEDTVLEAPGGCLCQACEDAERAKIPVCRVGARVIDADGFRGTIVKITKWRGSVWYDVRFAGGYAVRYPADVTPVSQEHYAAYVAYFAQSNPGQTPMAYEHWEGATGRHITQTVKE